jgi:hypothetical protein
MAFPSPYPLSLGRVFELGWSIFKFSWRTMILAAATCLAPGYVATTVISAAYSPRFNDWIAQATRATTLNQPVPPAPPDFDVGVFLLIASSIFLITCSLVAAAALIRITDLVYRGGRTSALDSVRYALGRLLSLLAGQLLYLIGVLIILLLGVLVAVALIVGGGLLIFLGLVVIVGTIAAILFLAVRTSLLAPAVVIEHVGGTDGFGRTWKLVAGSGWRVFGYLFLTGLLVGLLGLLLGGIPAALLGLTHNTSYDVALTNVIEALVGIVTAPLAPVVLTLLYFDLRWQRGETVPVAGGGEIEGRPQKRVDQQPWAGPR